MVLSVIPVSCSSSLPCCLSWVWEMMAGVQTPPSYLFKVCLTLFSFPFPSAAGESRGTGEGTGEGRGTKDAAQRSCLSKHAEAGRACSGAGHCLGRGQEHSLAPLTLKPEGSGASPSLRAHPSHSTSPGPAPVPFLPLP